MSLKRTAAHGRGARRRVPPPEPQLGALSLGPVAQEEELPTVELGLTYEPWGLEEEEASPVRKAAIPGWILLTGLVFWGANKLGERI